MLLERDFMMLAPDGLDGGSPSGDENLDAGGEGAGNVDGTPSSGSEGAASGGSDATEFVVKIDGEEKKVPVNELITRYQKEAAAEKRFQEASEKEKAAEKHVKAFRTLENLIKSKNVEGIKQVLGDDFISELVKGNSPELQKDEPEYSAEDLYIANKLGIDVNELVATRSEALGIDKPVVNELKTKTEAYAKKIQELEKKLSDFEVKTQSSSIEAHFNSFKPKYPDFDARDFADVIDIIDREKFSASEFDKAFKMQEEVVAKREAERDKRLLEKKKKQASNLLEQSGSGNISIKEDEFKGLSGKAKLEKLKKMYASTN